MWLRLQKWITLTLVPNRSYRAVAGDDQGGIRQGQEAGVDAAQEGGGVPSGEVGAAYRPLEEGVTCQ